MRRLPAHSRHQIERTIASTCNIDEDTTPPDGSNDSGLRQHIGIYHSCRCTDRAAERVMVVTAAQRSELIPLIEQMLPELHPREGSVRIAPIDHFDRLRASIVKCPPGSPAATHALLARRAYR